MVENGPAVAEVEVGKKEEEEPRARKTRGGWMRCLPRCLESSLTA